ncbi:MAG: NAD(P)H-dependent oxidoreductase subunit E, partial [Chloroflexi bacterium]|nr:NAD(P)H-dependent oxidoreductase subunit E [Chloroflexota bacterium]
MIREKYADVIEELFRRYPEKKSAILPLMHMAQHEYGYMSEEAMIEVADILGINPT